ncbi:HAD family hydrolase [Edaphobacillus lindanitolerans]|uniref:Haloacid dehalogenase superfamily, subfamily IA, variant 1 with third motif having Dx(3-4)D or Dx(3-4)E n=1 Tax=Edaphobacillus lindanitolerans TaxID=550447 RepID=A0A1U7PSV7_9BACI|nr:HAD family hydrolase [Edaphobacillus lindanitolerans]SIT91087.1 haloacid dehalogenase superfamily, subfamily IA, variant 1 with third motif having Dx(3-4)D or Dx(3-4)E [Edaphobacillus lindanitolerans]
MYKNIIFDVDGTILDTETAILNSLQQVLREEGREYSQDELKFALGIPGMDALRILKVDEMQRVHAKWSKTVLDFSHEVRVFEGLKEVISKLSGNPGLKTGIVTSKTKQELIDEFDPFDMNHLFGCITSASDTDNHKPHPDPLLHCLNGLDADPDNSLYIGDSIYDMQCAHGAGVKFALALWGAKTTDGFEAADYVLNEPEDILKLLGIGTES